MVVVYQRGKIPITYSASICSCATLVTILIYAAALVFPYLIAGATNDFFTLSQTRYEQPFLSTSSEISITIPELLGPGLDAIYSIPRTTENTVPAIYERSARRDQHSISFSVIIPTGTATSSATSLSLSFPYYVNFTDALNHVFEGTINLDLESSAPTCGVNIHGTLGFNQQLPYSESHLPAPNGYIEFAQQNNLPVTESDPRLYGEPYFVQNSVDYTFGHSTTYTINFEMTAPLIAITVTENFWYAFLSGWTTYIAIAIPFFIFAHKILEFLFGSGIIRADQHYDAVVDSAQRIPKFNR